jgi:hypothetical protein
MKTVAIILRQNRKYHFVGQETSASHRSHGTVIADCAIDTARELVANGLADIYQPGQARRSVEFLDPTHPLSLNQIGLRHRVEQEFLFRCAMNARQ